MTTSVHTYKYPNRERYVTKSGEVHYHKGSTTIKYKCKMHHPDAAEMRVIREEIAAGMKRKEVMERHNIGTYERLARLLKKFEVKGADGVSGADEVGGVNEVDDVSEASTGDTNPADVDNKTERI